MKKQKSNIPIKYLEHIYIYISLEATREEGLKLSLENKLRIIPPGYAHK